MTERRTDTEEALYEQYADFSGGMAAGLTPGNVPPNAALWAVNVDPARGGLHSRYGRQRVGNRLPSASSTCYWLGMFRKREAAGSVTRQALRINSHDLFELIGPPDPTGIWTFRGSVSSERITTGLQFVNRMWFGDGIVDGKVWDGDTLQPWGWPAPVTPSFGPQSATGGHLFDGSVYGVVYVLVDPLTGEKTNPSEAIEVTISTGTDTSKVALIIPANPGMPPRFTKVWVYRTPADEAFPLFESEHDYSGASITVDVGVRTDSDLGEAAEFDNDPPPKLSWFVLFEGQFFGSGPDAPSVLLNSKVNAPWAWPALNTLNINLDDGDELIGGFVMHGTLFVFKRRSAHAVGSHPIFGYSSSQLPADIGCLSHHSLVIVGNLGYGFDDQGLWRFNGAQFERVANLMVDFFDQARRGTRVKEAVAVREPVLSRPYYRVALEGPDPRTGELKPLWVNLLDTTGGVYVYDGWEATYLAVMSGLQDVQEVWSGGREGAVYRHFVDAEGNELYYDHTPDAEPIGIGFDYRSPDLSIGIQQVPIHEHRLVTGWLVELERSDGPVPMLDGTEYVDGLQASGPRQFTGQAGLGARATEHDYWRLRGTPGRRHGFRFSGSGTYDFRLASMTAEYRPMGLRLPGIGG